jgi:hypothetical protein
MKYLSIITYKTLVLSLLLLPILAMAQPKDNSPYSRFGIGDLVDNNFYASQSMGGLGVSFIDPYNINIVNPASLSYLAATSFDLGLHAEQSKLKERASGNDVTQWNGNLSYMSLAFPLQNKLNDLLDRKERNINLGMAFTLIPYSTVGYDIATSGFDENFGSFNRSFRGTGGTYQFMWSNGIRYKNLAFGINTGYLFGEISNTRAIIINDVNPSYISVFENSSSISGFVYRAGLMYTHFLNKEAYEAKTDDHLNRLIFGVHGNTTTSFNASSDIFNRAELYSSGQLASIDTLSFEIGNKEKGTLPSELGLGVTFIHGEKLGIGINYTTTQWSKFNSEIVNDNLKNTFKLSFGGFYRPNYKSVTNYFSRVQYRFGTFYEKVPVEVNGEAIDDYGLTFGLGLPFFYQRKISNANLGLKIGLRGKGSAIEERYFRFTFSFTFNDDEWFVKRKYN